MLLPVTAASVETSSVLFMKKIKWPDVKIVAINDTAKPEATVHLTKFDTTHGKFNGDVYWDDGHLVVNGDRIFHVLRT